jgi:hypothetical protein
MSLYYTDPLKAAIMMRDHGINFIGDDDEPIQPFLYSNGLTWRINVAGDDYEGFKYIVAPESLPLFQPMVGDIWKSEQHIGYISIEGKMCANGSVIEPFSKIEILQRNGKQFYMAAGE